MVGPRRTLGGSYSDSAGGNNCSRCGGDVVARRGSRVVAGPGVWGVNLGRSRLHPVHDTPGPSSTTVLCGGGVLLLHSGGARGRGASQSSGGGTLSAVTRCTCCWRCNDRAWGAGSHYEWRPDHALRVPPGILICECSGATHAIYRCTPQRQSAAAIDKRRRDIFGESRPGAVRRLRISERGNSRLA